MQRKTKRILLVTISLELKTALFPSLYAIIEKTTDSIVNMLDKRIAK